MFIILRLAGATELAFVCIEGLMPSSNAILPLGGNHLAQVGAVFGIAFVVKEVSEALTPIAGAVANWLRQGR